jgi:predicted Zn-dependent protease
MQVTSGSAPEWLKSTVRSVGRRLRAPSQIYSRANLIVSRRIKLEEMLATEPDDPFLNYALALETAKEDRQAGLARLADMNTRFPQHVPAYFRRGQILAEIGEIESARQVLTAGIRAARSTGDDHAATEMQELMSSL